MIGTMTVTSYRAIPEQTDDTPTITSIGHRVHPYGVAVSRDMLLGRRICYGDIVYIPEFGYKVVNDTMNKRHKNHIDIFVNTFAQEREIGVRKLLIHVIKSPKRKCTRSEAMGDRL